MRDPIGSVLIDASAATAGGGIGVVQDLVLATRELAPRQHVLVLASPPIVSVLEPLPPNVTLITIIPRRGVLGRVLRQQFAVPWRLRKTPLVAVLGPLGSFPVVLALRGVPSAVTVSNVSPFDPQIRAETGRIGRIRLTLQRLLIAVCARSAGTTWALSNASLEVILRHAKPRSARVLPVVPPGPHNMSSHAIQRSAHAFVVVADLYPHKGIEDAIRAIGQVVAAGERAELLICGREMDPDYAHRLHVLAKGSRVRFIGPMDRPSAIRLIAGARGLIHCSRMESLGRPLSEAMYVGTPIIAAELQVTREVCGDAAWYYTPGDVDSLAGLISSLLADTEAAERLGRRGVTRMAGRTWLDAPRAMLDRAVGTTESLTD